MKNFVKKFNKKAVDVKDPKKKKKLKSKFPKKDKKALKNTKLKKHSSDEEVNSSNNFEEVDESFDQDEEIEYNDDYNEGTDDELSPKKHKQALKNLEKIDPEFHEFLQNNDKDLLNFDSSASENEDEEHERPEPSEASEDASDASDYEEESVGQMTGKVTNQMVDTWEKELNMNKRTLKPVRIVVRAFHACLLRTSGDPSDQNVSGLRVDGSTIFNAVIRLCVTSLYPYLRKVLNLPSSSVTKKHVESSKKWPHAKSIIRSYLIDLVKLLNNVTSEDILRVLLKHLHQMIPLAACLPTISKSFLKQLINLWSTSTDDTVRVISFLCLLRYAACDLNIYLHSVLKKMYVSYVVNCKFISQNSLPAVNFLRKSLMEMFSLSETIAYNHAFLYIRQLAIQLRAAVTLKKKDSIQAVYNWQFISSLRLWVDVLCNMRDKQQMNSLVYPTIQIIIGCIKLIPTAQYFPLRFHCIQMLNKLSKELEIFIPVLPFLIEALTILHVNSKQKKLSMKPMDFTYILRLSKSQLQENAFKDAVVENVYDCLLEYTAFESYRISFPDTVVFLQIQVKQFLKECKNVNYTRKLKPLLEKIEETAQLMSQERSKCGIGLNDVRGIAAWEANMKLKSNPLIHFYESWSKLQEQKSNRKQVDEIKLNEYELPVLKKLPGKKDGKKEKSKKKKDNELEDSDVEDSSDEVQPDFEKKGKKNKKKINDDSQKTGTETNKSKRKIKERKTTNESKKRKLVNSDLTNDTPDIVEDLNIDEFLSCY